MCTPQFRGVVRALWLGALVCAQHTLATPPSHEAITSALSPRGLTFQQEGIQRHVDLYFEFAHNASDLAPSNKDALATLAMALTAPSLLTCHVTLIGHTDASGDAGYNQSLSLRRAQAVRTALMSDYAIDGQRLIAVGKGEEALLPGLAPTDKHHRRVEVRLADAGPCAVGAAHQDKKGDVPITW